jgi:hypothetical protein
MLKLLARLITSRGQHEATFFASKQHYASLLAEVDSRVVHGVAAVVEAQKVEPENARMRRVSSDNALASAGVATPVAHDNTIKIDANELYVLPDEGLLPDSSLVNGESEEGSENSDSEAEEQNVMNEEEEDEKMSPVATSSRAAPAPVPSSLFENKLAEFGLIEGPRVKPVLKSDIRDVKDEAKIGPSGDKRSSSRSVSKIDTSSLANPSKSSSSSSASDKTMAIWDEVSSLLRPLQYIIFNNYKLFISHTPEIIHVILILISQQPPLHLRHGIHSLLGSLLHGLISFASTMPTADDDIASEIRYCTGVDIQSTSNSNTRQLLISDSAISVWKMALKQLSEPAPSQIFSIFNEVVELTQNNVDVIVSIVSSIVCETTPSLLCNMWRKILWKLTLNSAVKTLPHSSSSTFFLCISSLIQKEFINIDVLWDLFTSLDYVINLYTTKKATKVEEKLLEPTFKCISKVVPFLDTLQIKMLFWFSILLIQCFPDTLLYSPFLILYCSVNELLHRIDTNNSNNSINGDGVNEFIEKELLDIYNNDSEIASIFSYLESFLMYEISFQSSFSTALTKILLKGYNLPSTHDMVVGMLTVLMKHSQSAGKEHLPGISGYAVLLLITNRDEMSVSHGNYANDISSNGNMSVIANSGSGLPLSRHTVLPSSFFGTINFPDLKHSVLFVSSILSILQSSLELDEHRHYLLLILLQTIQEIPNVLTVLYDVVFSTVMESYTTNSNIGGIVHTAIFNILNECLTWASKNECVDDVLPKEKHHKRQHIRSIPPTKDSPVATSAPVEQKVSKRSRLFAFLKRNRSFKESTPTSTVPTVVSEKNNPSKINIDLTSKMAMVHESTNKHQENSIGLTYLHDIGFSGLLEERGASIITKCICSNNSDMKMNINYSQSVLTDSQNLLPPVILAEEDSSSSKIRFCEVCHKPINPESSLHVVRNTSINYVNCKFITHTACIYICLFCFVCVIYSLVMRHVKFSDG